MTQLNSIVVEGRLVGAKEITFPGDSNETPFLPAALEREYGGERQGFPVRVHRKGGAETCLFAPRRGKNTRAAGHVKAARDTFRMVAGRIERGV